MSSYMPYIDAGQPKSVSQDMEEDDPMYTILADTAKITTNTYGNVSDPISPSPTIIVQYQVPK